jgi:ligand-binding sensor domain-containing protein
LNKLFLLLSDWSIIIKLNFDLNQSSIVINDHSMQGIYFDLSDNNIYIASWSGQSIFIYHTNDEITFNKIGTIRTSYLLLSITINNDKIYIGTKNEIILVYNKTNKSLVQVMDKMCSNSISSVKYDCMGNMIYLCWSPPMVKMMGTNDINSTLLLNDLFNFVFEAFIDSKNRLWTGGNNGFIVFD